MSLWPSPWPAEDGGPARPQTPRDTPGLGLTEGERLQVTSRDALASTMLVLRDPGELFLLRHTLGPHGPDDPVETWVERIDPITLAPLGSSPRLPAGPFWPGGLVAHANGSLHVTAGRWCHRLSADLRVLGSRELPHPRPYNSLVVLASGVLVMKDLDRSAATPTTLSVLDPETLEPLDVQEAPEPSIARLSAVGDTVYLVGDHTLSRWDWDGRRLARDESWELRYRTDAGQGYGWDVVLAGGHAWLMDNGEHDYVTTMLGAGVASGPVHLVRVSLTDASDHELVPVCGAPGGAVTNPPLFDPERQLAVAYDSANGVLAAFELRDGRLQPRWRRELNSAGHLLLFGDTGELVAYDFHPLPGAGTRLARSLGARGARLVQSRRFRQAAARLAHEDVLVLDLETGVERARATVPSMFQSVLFPCPGWSRDFYYCSFSTVARIATGC
ncbi:MAG: hypothetical protein QOE60_3012 [Thermoleophilaceae bacterium]|nr:hypothetical protein [Thermoleophilaceae bacterium]